MKEPKFLIVATGYNCKPYVKKCLDSIFAQTYQNFDIAIVSDGSTDGTATEIYEYCTEKEHSKHYVNMNLFVDNMGACYRRYHVINNPQWADNTIVCLLGLDDELLPDALETIAEQYRNGKYMTYGNWINQHGESLPKDFDLYFDEETHANRDYRKVKYRSTAMNTFYAKLFKQIPMQDFMLNGKWIDTTTESEVMFSCLEMCGKEKIGVVEKPIYLYNQLLPNGTQIRLGQEYKNSIYSEIIKRPKKDLTTWKAKQ